MSKYGVFSNPYFPVFVMNVVKLRIQSECGKIRTRKNSVFVHFSHNVSSRFNCLNNVFLSPVTIMWNHNFDKQLNQYRNSRPEVFSKKSVLRNFTNIAGKHLCQGLLKKRLWHRCFPVNFTKFLITSFLTEHLRWLLL